MLLLSRFLQLVAIVHLSCCFFKATALVCSEFDTASGLVARVQALTPVRWTSCNEIYGELGQSTVWDLEGQRNTAPVPPGVELEVHDIQLANVAYAVEVHLDEQPAGPPDSLPGVNVPWFNCSSSDSTALLPAAVFLPVMFSGAHLHLRDVAITTSCKSLAALQHVTSCAAAAAQAAYSAEVNRVVEASTANLNLLTATSAKRNLPDWLWDVEVLPGSIQIRSWASINMTATNVKITCNPRNPSRRSLTLVSSPNTANSSTAQNTHWPVGSNGNDDTTGHPAPALTSYPPLSLALVSVCSAGELRVAVESLQQQQGGSAGTATIMLMLNSNITFSDQGVWAVDTAPMMINTTLFITGRKDAATYLDVQMRVGIMSLTSFGSIVLQELVLVNEPPGSPSQVPFAITPMFHWWLDFNRFFYPTAGRRFHPVFFMQNIVVQVNTDDATYTSMWLGQTLSRINTPTPPTGPLTLLEARGGLAFNTSTLLAKFNSPTTKTLNVTFAGMQSWPFPSLSMSNSSGVLEMTQGGRLFLTACFGASSVEQMVGIMQQSQKRLDNLAVWVMEDLTFNSSQLPVNGIPVTKSVLVVGYKLRMQALDFAGRDTVFDMAEGSTLTLSYLTLANLAPAATSMHQPLAPLMSGAWGVSRSRSNTRLVLQNVSLVVSPDEVAFLYFHWPSIFPSGSARSTAPPIVKDNTKNQGTDFINSLPSLPFPILRAFGYDGNNITLLSASPSDIKQYTKGQNYSSLLFTFMHIMPNHSYGDWSGVESASSGGGDDDGSDLTVVIIVIVVVGSTGVVMLVAAVVVAVVVARRRKNSREPVAWRVACYERGDKIVERGDGLSSLPSQPVFDTSSGGCPVPPITGPLTPIHPLCPKRLSSTVTVGDCPSTVFNSHSTLGINVTPDNEGSAFCDGSPHANLPSGSNIHTDDIRPSFDRREGFQRVNSGHRRSSAGTSAHSILRLPPMADCSTEDVILEYGGVEEICECVPELTLHCDGPEVKDTGCDRRPEISDGSGRSIVACSWHLSGEFLAGSPLVASHGMFAAFDSIIQKPRAEPSGDALSPTLSKVSICRMLEDLTDRVAEHAEDSIEALQLHEVLGRGSQGLVHRGTWRGLAVAVKVRLLAGGDVALQQRAAQEVAMMMRLSHDNVVHIYTFKVQQLATQLEDGHSNSTTVLVPDLKLLIVQELCNGGTLQAAIDSGTYLPPAPCNLHACMPALLTALDIACGMAHVHQAGIVHGDLNPANILLHNRNMDAARPVAKVADFGIGRFLGAGASCVMTGNVCGTDFYTAPEVLAEGRVSRAGDVYSFGVVLWELLHGTPVWRKQETSVVPPAHTSPESWTASLLPGSADLDPLLLHLIKRCLDQHPKARPTFEEILGSLMGMVWQNQGHTSNSRAGGASSKSRLGSTARVSAPT